MLQELLNEEPAEKVPKDVAMEKKTAQLYLLSDILFNSQQPGVRNAFRYRDAIEKMAPVVFTALGRMEWGGRLTRNKLAVEISSILAAWTNWSVYSPSFLDELHDRFEGREVKPKLLEEKTSLTQHEDDPRDETINSEPDDADPQPSPSDEQKDSAPKGDWDVIEHLSEERVAEAKMRASAEESRFIQNKCQTKDYTMKNCSREDSEVNGHRVDDVDGEPLEEDSKDDVTSRDVDGEPLDDEYIDGESIGEEFDGETLSDENIDGESIDEDVL
jgi:U2-associated protein SR140